MLAKSYLSWSSLLSALLLLCWLSPAQAVPSFARQTGFACSACHTSFPELTAFGRQFKLGGYTLTVTKQVEAEAQGGNPNLKIDELPPFSLMFITSATQVKTAVPDSSTNPNTNKTATSSTQNGNIEFPQQMSVFYAGAISQHLGAFAQMTYTHDSDHFTMDNTDIRYTHQFTVGDTPVIWGLDINNNPTVEDVWQGTPAWGFPYTGPNATPGAIATPLIAGGLAQDVAGAGSYLSWGDHWYGDLTLYRSEHVGASQPYDSTTSGTIAGVAPYWRFAYQNTFGDNYLEVGTYGLTTSMHPSGVTGASDGYLDTAIDAQFEHTLSEGMLSFHGTLIHERNDWRASSGIYSNAHDQLNSLSLNGSWHIDAAKSLTLGYFDIYGSKDALRYAPAQTTGSASGSPDTSGWLFQATYYPAQNAQVGVQYTLFNRFNGGSSNYDGSGRSASGNNTVYAYLWFMW